MFLGRPNFQYEEIKDAHSCLIMYYRTIPSRRDMDRGQEDKNWWRARGEGGGGECMTPLKPCNPMPNTSQTFCVLLQESNGNVGTLARYINT